VPYGRGLKLRGGAITRDGRLDRVAQLDPRNRNHPVTARLPEIVERKTKVWSLDRRWLGDQGQEGACVEYGLTHVISAMPVRQKLAIIRAIRAGHRIYWPAQRTDPWPGGSYPGATPFYEGTSEEAGMLVLRELGAIDGFDWAFGIDQGIAGVVNVGPANLALNWTEGMMHARPDGLITDQGSVVGGHDVAWTGVRFGVRLPGDGPNGPKRDLAVIPQSWGLDFGNRGFVYLTLEDLASRLRDDGTCAFLRGERQLTTLPA
jgi:hypothetical protein